MQLNYACCWKQHIVVLRRFSIMCVVTIFWYSTISAWFM